VKGDLKKLDGKPAMMMYWQSFAFHICGLLGGISLYFASKQNIIFFCFLQNNKNTFLWKTLFYVNLY